MKFYMHKQTKSTPKKRRLELVYSDLRQAGLETAAARGLELLEMGMDSSLATEDLQLYLKMVME